MNILKEDYLKTKDIAEKQRISDDIVDIVDIVDDEDDIEDDIDEDYQISPYYYCTKLTNCDDCHLK